MAFGPIWSRLLALEPYTSTIANMRAFQLLVCQRITPAVGLGLTERLNDPFGCTGVQRDILTLSQGCRSWGAVEYRPGRIQTRQTFLFLPERSSGQMAVGKRAADLLHKSVVTGLVGASVSVFLFVPYQIGERYFRRQEALLVDQHYKEPTPES